MLGLIIDKINKKAPFDIFIENFLNYKVRTVNKPEDLISVVHYMIESRSSFDNINKTKYLTDEENNPNAAV